MSRYLLLIGLCVSAQGCARQQVATYEDQQHTSYTSSANPSVLDLDNRTIAAPTHSTSEGDGQSATLEALNADSPAVHVVQPKDTLYGLARVYYEDGKQWRRIYDANQERIKDPNIIKVGMKLIIP